VYPKTKKTGDLEIQVSCFRCRRNISFLAPTQKPAFVLGCYMIPVFSLSKPVIPATPSISVTDPVWMRIFLDLVRNFP
jgi:hypothetical protein